MNFRKWSKTSPGLYWRYDPGPTRLSDDESVIAAVARGRRRGRYWIIRRSIQKPLRRNRWCHCQSTGIVCIIVSYNKKENKFDELQQLWGRWWQLTREELDGKHLAKEKVLLIYSINKIADWIEECDTLLYNNLGDLLIPDVLRQVFHAHVSKAIIILARQLRRRVG